MTRDQLRKPIGSKKELLTILEWVEKGIAHRPQGLVAKVQDLIKKAELTDPEEVETYCEFGHDRN